MVRWLGYADITEWLTRFYGEFGHLEDKLERRDRNQK